LSGTDSAAAQHVAVALALMIVALALTFVALLTSLDKNSKCSRSVNFVVCATAASFYSRLTAGGRIAAALYRTSLKISTAGKSGHAKAGRPKCPCPWEDLGSTQFMVTLRPAKSTSQTASRSVGRFVALMVATNRQTDHATTITIGRILCYAWGTKVCRKL